MSSESPTNCSQLSFIERVLSFTYNERVFEFLANTVLSGIIIIAGLVGNTISIMVLKRDWQRSSMSVLLLVLAIFDSLFLIMSIYYMIVFNGIMMLYPHSFIHIYDSIGMRILLLTVWYLGHVSRTGRNWIIVVVAIDRFIVVHNPLAAARQSNSYRAKMYSLATLILACIYNIPRPLEWTFKTSHDWCTNSEVTSMDLAVTFSHVYVIGYMSIGYCVMIAVGPVLLLTIFNLLLTASLIEAHKIRAHLTQHSVTADNQMMQPLMCSGSGTAGAVSGVSQRINARGSGRYNETKMLIVVIAVFVVTELPTCVFQIMLTHSTLYKTVWFNGFWTYFKSSMDVLTMINSSANFLIYCMCGRRFRKNMRIVLRLSISKFCVCFATPAITTQVENRHRHHRINHDDMRVQAARDGSRVCGTSGFVQELNTTDAIHQDGKSHATCASMLQTQVDGEVSIPETGF